MRPAHAIAAIGAVALLATVAVAQEKSQEERAAEARQGFMRLIVWEAGPLFAMAKGDIGYDADLATTRAENLSTLAQYAGHTLFLPGSSVDDLGDATRALPAIWERQDEFHGGFDNLREQAANVVAEAGKGADQLRAAVGQLGNACGDCHEAFRLKD